jgi:SAM-dependent methyltransferase
LDAIYRKADQFTSHTYTDPERIAAIVSYMSSCLRRILAARTTPLAQPAAVLELGAGFAWMCRAAKQLNNSTKTIAQDVSAEVASKCRWVDEYVVCDMSDQRLDLFGPYDLISLTHVIEHLPDPVAATQRCKSLLSKGGTILMTAPFRPKGWEVGKSAICQWQQYSYNHVPAHIQYFSKESMQRMAEKAGCTLCYWNNGEDNGQAFEAWLE